MSIYTWIGLIGATIATFFPLLTRKKLQKDERIAVIRNSFILIGVLVSVFILQINSFIVIVAALIAAVVLDKKRSEEHTSELQSRFDLVCRLLLEKKKYR